ncbi:hypothetical protein WJX82_010089 [Trebouxia sp. C0006]
MYLRRHSVPWQEHHLSIATTSQSSKNAELALLCEVVLERFRNVDDLSRHVSVIAGYVSVSALNIEVMTPPRTRSHRKRSARSSEDSQDAYPASKQTGAIEGALQPQSSTPTDASQHSAWAASILPTADTNRPVSTNGVDILLPVKTRASVVSKMVESLHSGTISLGHENVEQMLMLSHAMKVKLVEAACKEYLLDLDLSLEQLCQLVLLWGDGTRLEAARKVLQSPSCGKMCELQVFDMLLSAGMSISDPLLSTFFQVTCIDDAAFSFLEHAVQPSTTSRPSYELLIKIVARTAKFASWADASSCAQEHLMMVAFDDKCELSTCDFAMRWDDLILRVKLPCPGADASSEMSADLKQFRLELISPEETLTRREAETVVLYSVSKSAPIVKPLCEWRVGDAGHAWTASSCDVKGIESQLASEEQFCLGLRVCKQ